MRFVAIALFLLAIPLLVSWMQGSVRNKRIVWTVIGSLPFVGGWLHLDASFISWAYWPGYVKGMLVSLLDASAVAVLLSSPPQRGRTPFAWLVIAYIVVAALAIVQADVKMAAFFFAWQLARVLLVMLAVTRIAAQPNGARCVINGILLGALLQAYFAIYQRLHGIDQAGGTMGHQNLLGMMMHFAAYPALALILAGRRDKLLFLGFAASIICMMLTGSRGTIGIAAGGIVAMIILSLARNWTGRKAAIAGAGVAALLVVAPLGIATLQKRMANDTAARSNEEREAFKRAAWMIIDDHPMGVGGNQYVVVANTAGYSQRAGVAWNDGSRSTNVHNTYLLMTAELGYLGGAVFLLLMILPPLAALRFAWADKRDPRGELALGAGVALAAVAIHCMYEWVYVLFAMQYYHAMGLGIVAGLILQRQRERRPTKRRRVASPPALPQTPATA